MSMKAFLFNPGADGAGRDFGLLVLRLGVGATLALGHGLGKAQSFLAGRYEFPDPLGVGAAASLGMAAFGEFVCGLLVAVGLFGRLATIPVATTMSVAFFIVHAADPFGKKELALLYLIGAVALLFTGPGRFSFDGLLSRRQ